VVTRLDASRLVVAASVLAVGGLCPLLARAAEIPNAVIVLEVPPQAPGSDPKAAAPPRFVLLKDGQVFVGGTGRLAAGKLDKAEQQALRRSVETVRKAAGKSGALAFGNDVGAAAMRLRLPDDRAEIMISGDPAAVVVASAARRAASAAVAPPPVPAPVAAALLQLLRFDHASLQPYRPASYALAAREQRLTGGCRPWSFVFPIQQVVTAPVAISAAEAEGWPTGSWPASVCVGDKRYVVELRPLLPGEQP
jgi:hypothetical protein